MLINRIARCAVCLFSLKSLEGVLIYGLMQAFGYGSARDIATSLRPMQGCLTCSIASSPGTPSEAGVVTG